MKEAVAHVAEDITCASVSAGTGKTTSAPADPRSRFERVYEVVEYVLTSCVVVCFFAYGFVRIKHASAEISQGLLRAGVLVQPLEFMRNYLSSVAYDLRADPQWWAYSVLVWVLALLAAVMAVLSWYVRRRGNADLLAWLYTAFGVGFVTVVHGPLFVLLLTTLSASYVVFSRLRRVLPRNVYLVVLWAVQVVYLYYVQEAGGFEESEWARHWLRRQVPHPLIPNRMMTVPLWPVRLRWSVALRMSTLRMIAYHTDELEAATDGGAAAVRVARKHDTSCLECAALRDAHRGCGDDGVRCYKYRTERPRDAREYGYVRYMAYVLFPPLYIGGPITSYNAFTSHLETPSCVMPLRAMVAYVLRIAFVYVLNVFLLHYLFVNSFRLAYGAVQRLGNGDKAFLMIHGLAFLWLKFTFIWRTSRLFALWCGVEAPENMRRCFANSATVRDFWRDWHASFNLWIVRYMYIPMGGRRRQLLAVVPIFLFVALWHDHTLSMLEWAACIVVFFIVETLVSGAFRRVSSSVSCALDELDAHDGDCVRRGLAARVARCVHARLSPPTRRLLHHLLCVAGGSAGLLTLVIVNLIGFYNQSRTQGGRSYTDMTIVGVMRSMSWRFLLGTTLFIVCAATAALDRRHMEATRRARQARKLGVSI